MPLSLLATKLYIPPVRAELVPRLRLIERLNEGLTRKLTLVSAPAGFGKTTLLNEWITNLKSQISNFKVAWLSLDESDNDLARFLAYVIAALQTVAKDVGQALPDALPSSQPPAWGEFVIELINQINDVPDHLILVLDDYHHINAQPIHDTVAFLLDHLPANLHLVVATRADPPLPIPRLRGRGLLNELRLNDLRFTLDETATFLESVIGLKLTTKDIATLNARTEGWVAGLQMAAASMQGQRDIPGFIQALTGSNRYILDYLIEEVLQRQPEPIQAFLLQTSILDRLCGSLCDAVIRPSVTLPTTSQTILESLEHTNLFIVPLDDHFEWYRYHRLFADLLNLRLHQSEPELVPVLHCRASAWYEQHGLTEDAIEHAACAQDYERAARLIEQAAPPTLARSEIATLLRWLDLLPGEAARARPRLRLYQAMALLLSGQSPDVVETILREAESAEVGGADASGAITGEATALRALAAAYQGDAPRAVQLARRALELLPEDNLLLRGFAIGSLGLSYLWAEDLDAAVRTFEEGARIGEKVGNVMFAVIALRRVGRLRMAQGRLHEAKAVFDHALELAVDRHGRRLPIAGLVLTGLGYLAREWNDLEAAARYLTEGIELAQGTSAAMTIGAHFALARVRQAQGDPAGAREALHKAAQLAAQTEATGLDDLGVAMNQALLCLGQGDLGPALVWARSRGLDQPVDALVRQASEESAGGLIRRYEIPALAKLLLAQQRPRDALALLDLILPRVEREGRFEIVIQIEALRALAFQAAGHPAQALKTLERALALAEPSGYIRLFVDEGEPLKLLIARMLTSEDFRLMLEKRTRGESQKLIEYTNKLLAAFPKLAPVTPPQSEINNLQSAMVEPLSEREVEVLRLLAAGLSNPEIAERLCLTVNTIRSHVKSIYGKLNVHSRYEATVKAQDLRLL